MENNSSRPNYGPVSRIQFKLGTGIEHPRGITWHDKGQKVKGRGHNVT